MTQIELSGRRKPASTVRHVFTYKVFTQDGDELGEATYLEMVDPGEEIHVARGPRYLVRKVVLFRGYESSYAGPLEVEPAS